MSDITLKSNNALKVDVDKFFNFYKKRVLADGGSIVNEDSVKEAIGFVIDNKIPADLVFSATSPSWGVKGQGNTPEKLYSLFSSGGDMVFAVEDFQRLSLESDDKKVVRFSGRRFSERNYIESAGTFSITKGVALAVVCKAYSDGQLLDAANQIAYVGRADKYLPEGSSNVLQRLTGFQYDNVNPNDTSNWGLLVQNSYSSTQPFRATTSSPRPPVSNEYLTNVAFIDEGSLTLYDSEGVNGERNGYKSRMPTDQLIFSLGMFVGYRLTVPEPYPISRVKSLNADIAEAWLIRDVESDVALSLATRLSENYK